MQWAPWFLTLLSILTSVWTMSTSFSTVRLIQTEHGKAIDSMSKSFNDEQALLYSISTQLAQLQQSVADIKANEQQHK